MGTDYPAGLDSFDEPSAPTTTALGSAGDTSPARKHSEHHRDLGDAIEAIQAELGLNPAGSETDVVTRLNRSVRVSKLANETVNNTTTLQNDDELFVPVLVNERWMVHWFLIGASPAAPDYKFAITIPSGSLRWGFLAPTPSVNPVTGSGTSLSVNGQDGLEQIIVIEGRFNITGTAGNIQLQWAQNTATAANTIIWAGSWMVAERLS